jgi:hypothetical protein
MCGVIIAVLLILAGLVLIVGFWPLALILAGLALLALIVARNR